MSPPRDRAKYLALSAGTGVIELGLPVLAIRSGASLGMAVATGLAYQLGAPLARGLSSHAALTLTAVAGSVAVSVHAATANVGVLLLAAGALAHVLQAGRQRVRGGAGTSTAVKRSARIAGFVLAGLASPWLLLATAVALSAIAIKADPAGEPASSRLVLRPSTWRLLMAVHQTHYFIYAYALVWTLETMPGIPTFAFGVAFSVGWVTYTVAPICLAGFRPRPLIVAGHAWTAAMLLGLSVATRPGHVLLLWALTGFGGGTVFAIRAMCARAGDDDATIDHWEEVGHVLGAAVALTLALATSGDRGIIFIAAAIVAASVSFATAVLPHPSHPAALAANLRRSS